MKRRRVLHGIGTAALLAVLPLRAQQPGRVYRIGSAYVAPKARTQPYEDAFLAGMREQGFELGKNLVYEARHCDGDPARLPAAVDELIALKPDLLVGIEQVAAVMRSKTSTIPIVLTFSPNPVGAGLAKTLARPGGNVTGIAVMTEVLGAKSVELFMELLPKTKTLAVFLDPNVPAAGSIERHVQEMAKAKGVRIATHWVKDRPTLEQAFAALGSDRPDGLLSVSGSGALFGELPFMAESALRLRIPYAGFNAETVEAGALYSYSSSLRNGFRRAASHAAKILRGANPAEIPIEQPTQFEVVLNLKTARALGIKVPQSIQLRADRVIE